MDAVDSWVEDCRDGCFRRGDDEWVPFEVRTERILRKGGEPVGVVYYENLHGALDGDPNVPGRYLATRWASSDSGARSLDAARAMFDAATVAEGMRHLGRLETAWNWVLADRQGIGYQMSGRMPLRSEGVRGFVPRPGWDPTFDWQGYVEPQQLPRCIDPEDGYVVTANQDLNALGESDPINRPMGDYRARRIAELLAARDDHDRSSFSAIQHDVRSIQVEPFLEVLRPHLPDTAAGRCMRDWDHGYAPDSRGAAVFEAFYRALCAQMFGATLGTPVVEHLLESTGVFIDFYQDFDGCLLDPDSPWLEGRLLAPRAAPTLHNTGTETARVVVVEWAAEARPAAASGRFAETRAIRHRFPLRLVPSAFRDVLSPRDLHLLLGPRGGRMRYGVTGPDELLVALASTPPGTGPALHVHTQSHEIFVVCEGRFRVRWGDAGEHEALLEPFNVVAFPPGVNCTFENVGGEANWLMPIVVGANDELEDIVWLPPIREALLDRLPAAVVAVATRTVLKIRPRAALADLSRPG